MTNQAINEHDFLMYALKNDESAVDFCELLFNISQKIDDLYDQDKALSKEEIELMGWFMLVRLPNQPFYQQYFSHLNVLIQKVYTDWMDANALEKGDNSDKTIAFILRDSVGTLAVDVAYLVGGYEWGKHVGPEIRRFIHDEPLQLYINGLNKEPVIEFKTGTGD